LVITCDTSIFHDGSAAAKRALELASLFSEVHVIVLYLNTKDEVHSKRLGADVWVYRTHSSYWWKTIWDAHKVAKRQLHFGGGFRPDIIIADDPFEAGMAGYFISKKYNRPLQAHIKTDFFDPLFKARAPHNAWRMLMAGFLLPRVSCIRTQSEYMRGRIIEHFKKPEKEVAVLPVFYDLNAWRDAVPPFRLSERYPQFKFTLFHASSMNALSHTGEIIDGLFYILRQYPTIGLIIVGEGPDTPSLKQRVKEYSLSSQIIFEPMQTDLLPYVKSANVVIHASVEALLDRVVLMAAAVGVPMVCGSSGLASELFVDNESVMLCPVDSPPCFGEKVNKLLNDNALRRKLAMNARGEVAARVEQNYRTYLESYRASIEQCLLAEKETEQA
ncbi:MAG: glycosyltransferase family 4 protein, partial [bacterium]|nr:glycosyltransferase family 4 protein [bacterium]